MKKVLILFVLLAGLSFGQEKVELSLGVVVQPERIQFKYLEFEPEVVRTNVTMEWRTVDEVVTNLYLGVKPDEVVTNTVQQQFQVVSVTTNEAHWTAPFEYTIPAGESMLIAGALDARPRRAALMDVTLIIHDDDLTGLLGEDLAGRARDAAETFGPQPVKGPLAEALREAVLQAIAQGSAQ